jgi:heptosyltransferase-1
VTQPVRKILIIKPSALGDVVHGLPILHGLRTVYPQAYIAWMVRPAYADVIRGHPELGEPRPGGDCETANGRRDGVFEFDRKHFGRVGRSWPATRDFVRWLGRLAGERFDLVVDLQGLFRSGFFALASLARRRIGPASAREMSWLFYNQRVRPAPGVIHAVDRNYLFAAPLGFEHIAPRFELPIGRPARQAVADRLAREGVDGSMKLAVLVPGSTWASKRWPAERFARVAEHLAGRGVRTVLLGAANESDVGRDVRANSHAPLLDWIGTTPLKEAMALIERADIVVTNDSGPMHLAAALGRPLAAIFGPTDPARTGPYRRPETVVQALDGARHDYRHEDGSAIAAVSVEAVLSAVDRQLGT